MRISGSEIVVKTLIEHGVSEVFGYPGGSVIGLYDMLYQYRSRIKHYITAHEQGASHAADGYARATGKTGVVLATSGPGATNLVTGLATAYLDSTPMVAITANIAMELIGKDTFQEIDIVGVTMPLTKHNYIVTKSAELEDILCEAFQIANSGRPGPVLVDIPKDILAAPYEFRGGKPWPLDPAPEADAKGVEAAIELIRHSKKPYIYVGGGVVMSGAYKELLAFAEKIDAPVGFSMMGLSAMDARHPLSLGMMGMHGSYASTKARAECDLVIGAGVRFSDRATGNTKKYQENHKILHIDIDDAELGKNITDYTGLVGTLKEVLPMLSAGVEQQHHPEWRGEVEEYKKIETHSDFDRQGFEPRALISRVRDFAGEDTTIVTDVGQHQMWVAQYYPFCKPRTFLTSGGLGTMGFGMGAAIGASIGRGKKKTVLFTGDGCFHMNLNELAAAVTHGVPLVVLVLNNGVLGMVRQWQGVFFDRRFAETTLDRKTDYVKLAESFGAVGYRAETMEELNEALEKAFAESRPVVIDCPIDREEKVLPMIPPNGSIEDIMMR